MKKTLYLFLTVSLIFSSCKKDGDDNNTPTGVQGCTDPDATNYNASATNNDASCMYNISDVWETTSAILNGVEQLGLLVDVDLMYIFADGQIGAEGYKTDEITGELKLTGWSIGVASNLSPNSFLWEGSYYPQGGIADQSIEFVLNWNVDFMTNYDNMTWRYVDYPNAGDTYVKTLVRSTTRLLSQWQ
tara:strand:- start:538 stop:1101 length:564 start_codon:yes stop_codon:yes gene_type:complete